MNWEPRSLRPFIGSKNFKKSSAFYEDMGFKKYEISPKMSFFEVNEKMCFYLQDYYVKKWVNNTMLFIEVENVSKALDELRSKHLEKKYPKIKISDITYEDWGQEFFVHDPSGVLWHVGSFKE